MIIMVVDKGSWMQEENIFKHWLRMKKWKDSDEKLSRKSCADLRETMNREKKSDTHKPKMCKWTNIRLSII